MPLAKGFGKYTTSHDAQALTKVLWCFGHFLLHFFFATGMASPLCFAETRCSLQVLQPAPHLKLISSYIYYLDARCPATPPDCFCSSVVQLATPVPYL